MLFVFFELNEFFELNLKWIEIVYNYLFGVVSFFLWVCKVREVFFVVRVLFELGFIKDFDSMFILYNINKKVIFKNGILKIE